MFLRQCHGSFTAKYWGKSSQARLCSYYSFKFHFWYVLRGNILLEWNVWKFEVFIKEIIQNACMLLVLFPKLTITCYFKWWKLLAEEPNRVLRYSKLPSHWGLERTSCSALPQNTKVDIVPTSCNVKMARKYKCKAGDIPPVTCVGAWK